MHCGLQSVDQCGGAHCIAEVPIACNTALWHCGLHTVDISVEVAIADTMPDQLR